MLDNTGDKLADRIGDQAVDRALDQGIDQAVWEYFRKTGSVEACLYQLRRKEQGKEREEESILSSSC